MSSPRRKKSVRPGGLEQTPRRLEHLYEISKLFASFENAEQRFDPALGVVTRTLALRSAILIDLSKMIVWSSEGQSPEQVRAAKERARAAYAYLVGAASSESLDFVEQAGRTPLPPQEGTSGTLPTGFIVIPLVVAHRPPFGALQLEGAQPFDKADLMFVNAIANQLAIALDRDRAWRRDITRRERAEVGRTTAEARGATAERGRVLAESSSNEYEALAEENATLYEQAQKAVRVREQVLAIVSHDLRNPLQTILLTAGALEERAPEEERRHGVAEAVGRIQRAAERMVRLIEDLLDFASIEIGVIAIKRQPQEPGALLRETLASFEIAAREKQLGLTAEVAPQLPQADCDRDRILQVLGNLVGNAAKATAKGGKITLRVGTHGRELLFSVSDNGPGISKEDASHLFERYWRGGEAAYKGTGLGLAIARGIVSAHGGRIWVESDPGHGATFFFTIPVAEPAGVRPGEAASPSRPPPAALRRSL